jgi:hypothetical protein
LTVMTTVFCDITPYSSVHIYHPFSETSESFFQPTWRHITKDGGFHSTDCYDDRILFCNTVQFGTYIYHPFSETSDNFFQPTWRHITEDGGFHGIDCDDDRLLCCNTIQFGTYTIYITLSPKRRKISLNLHSVTLQKTAVYKQQVDGQGMHIIFIHK